MRAGQPLPRAGGRKKKFIHSIIAIKAPLYSNQYPIIHIFNLAWNPDAGIWLRMVVSTG
jgi:hypothetical protein